MSTTETSPDPYMFAHLRSCKKECDKAIEGEIKGEIPKWLKGCLVRIGTGLFEIGPDRFNLLFDGMALMHRFSFQDGKVTYQNRFLRSEAYKKNMKANRIVVRELATPAAPDPCKTIFQRFSSLFDLNEMSDNDVVNIVMYKDQAFACTESNFVWKIDPETLESIRKVTLSKYLPVNSALAHVHEDPDGTVYNVGTSYGKECSFVIMKFPPKDSKSGVPFENGSAICRITPAKRFTVSYHHSFSLTDNYFVIVEQPLYLSLARIAWAHFISGAYVDSMYWEENVPSRFHIVRRSDGKLLDTVYLAKGFFVFHHINAYEENNHLVIDMCCYEDASLLKALYIKAMEEMISKPRPDVNPFATRAKRFVLPLFTGAETEEATNKNLVTLANTEATAYRQDDGSIFCTPEILTPDEWCPELPRINYKQYNGKKYRYFYAMAMKNKLGGTHLVKVDTVNKTVLSWGEHGAIPSEPIFVVDPDEKNPEEDSGVVLASLLYRDNERKVSLLVLDARTMQEIGRVTFVTEASVPGDFHGTFIQK